VKSFSGFTVFSVSERQIRHSLFRGSDRRKGEPNGWRRGKFSQPAILSGHGKIKEIIYRKIPLLYLANVIMYKTTKEGKE
jgi:hypothetical protein